MSRFNLHDGFKSLGSALSRRDLLAALGALAVGSSGLGGEASTAGNASWAIRSQPIPGGPVTATTVSVSSIQTGTIPPSFAGFSYEKAELSGPLLTGANTNLIGLAKRLGSGVMRIGGNTVDKTNWNPTGPGLTIGETAPPDVDSLAAFLIASDWPVLYAVNFAQSNPTAAATEVAYVAKTLGRTLLGIEIGNEPDLYPGNYFPANWSFADFYARWQSFASAILAQTPGVPLKGPATAALIDWFTHFAKGEAKKVSMLSMHYYRGNAEDASSTIADLLSYPDTNLQIELSELEAAASAVGVPYRMTETNSFYNTGPPNVVDSYASALWVLDHIFTIAQGGGVGLNLQGGGNYGGPGPIADSNGVIVEARPEYYGLLLFTLAGQGPLLGTTIDAGTLNVSAYTIENSLTRLSMIVVNKDEAQNLHFTTTCPATVQSVTLQLLTGPSLASTSGVMIQGSRVNPDGSFAPLPSYRLRVSADTFTGYVPAASAALMVITLG